MFGFWCEQVLAGYLDEMAAAVGTSGTAGDDDDDGASQGAVNYFTNVRGFGWTDSAVHELFAR